MHEAISLDAIQRENCSCFDTIFTCIWGFICFFDPHPKRNYAIGDKLTCNRYCRFDFVLLRWNGHWFTLMKISEKSCACCLHIGAFVLLSFDSRKSCIDYFSLHKRIIGIMTIQVKTKLFSSNMWVTLVFLLLTLGSAWLLLIECQYFDRNHISSVPIDSVVFDPKAKLTWPFVRRCVQSMFMISPYGNEIRILASTTDRTRRINNIYLNRNFSYILSPMWWYVCNLPFATNRINMLWRGIYAYQKVFLDRLTRFLNFYRISPS